MALPPFRRDPKTELRAIVDDARHRLGARARSDLEQALERVRHAPASPRVAAAPRAVPAPQPMPRMSPARPLLIHAADGRTTRVALAPAVARRDDLAAIGRVCAANDRTAFQAAARHERAIEELAGSQEKLSAELAELKDRTDLALLGLLEQLPALRRRVEGVQRPQDRAPAAGKASRSTRVAPGRRELRAELRSQAAAARLQKVNAVVGSIQGAAFGEKGSLFATNNLLLAGNQLLWSFIDPLLRTVGLWSGPGPSPLGQLAPLGSLVTAYAALGRRQHIRFVSGVATIPAKAPVVLVPLRDRIAPGYFAEFRRRTDIPATAVVVSGNPVAVHAAVRDGVLFLAPVEPPGNDARIAWMVDTGAGNA